MLFDQEQESLRPLSEQMRPKKFEDIVGQDSILFPQSPLLKLLSSGRFQSLILWGPPGCGKTTLAMAAGASQPNGSFHHISAVNTGAKEIRAIIDQSIKESTNSFSSRILFIDEIHRLNKAQQDILLPAVERGQIRLIGATTENPSFEINHALLSRSGVFKLEPLGKEALAKIIKKAGSKTQRHISSELSCHLSQICGGDARHALNLLSLVLEAFPDESHLTLELFQQIGVDPHVGFDRAGDQHYDYASAMIKCIRAGQPDPALHYLAKMLVGGEDVMFIARRIVIAASEDIGNANPHGLMMAQAAADAVHLVGMPEARIILGQAVTFLATSPKSNRAYLAINAAIADVNENPGTEVPLHLRNGVTKLMQEQGYGKGYLYAHDHPEAASKQQCMPKALIGKTYYTPSQNGYEAKILSKTASQAKTP